MADDNEAQTKTTGRPRKGDGAKVNYPQLDQLLVMGELPVAGGIAQLVEEHGVVLGSSARVASARQRGRATRRCFRAAGRNGGPARIGRRARGAPGAGKHQPAW